jgi:flagellar secretion chaperone FliS
LPASAAKAEEMKRRYQREAVITATPAARLNMLFDKMILELGQADNGFERDDLKAVNDGLCRAQDILLALRGTLRTDLWAGANDLSQLYFALYKELLQANLKKNRAQAQRVLAVVQELAEAWRRAAEQETGGRLAATAAAAAVGA